MAVLFDMTLIPLTGTICFSIGMLRSVAILSYTMVYAQKVTMIGSIGVVPTTKRLTSLTSDADIDIITSDLETGLRIDLEPGFYDKSALSKAQIDGDSLNNNFNLPEVHNVYIGKPENDEDDYEPFTAIFFEKSQTRHHRPKFNI